MQSDLSAQKAFDNACLVFQGELDQTEPRRLDSKSTSQIVEFHNIINRAREIYETDRNNRPGKKWLSSLAVRIKLHGNILDVLVQQHPEYVALVWGAFKFLFTVNIQSASVPLLY